VFARQTLHFPQGAVHFQGVIGTPSLEKSIFIAKGTMVGATPGKNHGIGNEVFLPFNQIPSGKGKVLQAAVHGRVKYFRVAFLEILQKSGPGILSWSKK
jgi:hypothetical protein